MGPASSLLELMRAVARAEDIGPALSASPDLARAVLSEGATRADPTTCFLPEIRHYAYAGDTLLHLAAAAHRPALVAELLAAGADAGARNRRKATALHYACDGPAGVGAPDQRHTIAVLLEHGADVDAADLSGTTPLLRAVRNRCADAVEALLVAGADPTLTNRRGSTAVALATKGSGKSGSGSAEAKAGRLRIAELLGPG